MATRRPPGAVRIDHVQWYAQKYPPGVHSVQKVPGGHRGSLALHWVSPNPHPTPRFPQQVALGLSERVLHSHVPPDTQSSGPAQAFPAPQTEGTGPFSVGGLAATQRPL
jgi:hypothetical protein